jgi:hypothetical protein
MTNPDIPDAAAVTPPDDPDAVAVTRPAGAAKVASEVITDPDDRRRDDTADDRDDTDEPKSPSLR